MLKIKKFDIYEHLKTEKAVQGFLQAAFAENDPDFVVEALGIAAKARKLMSKAAKKAGVTREGLYKSLAKNGAPAFSTVMNVVNSLGYKLTLARA
ncbi:antitoxin [Candidatus Termititenax aidoneus]|uniref:Antitoxin n=1 Tax=Termititenax aidoneus TaxID=2218524 RepID=A0A388TD02_TERA1|nr:antitoxin [Candidatus Termititenax aidoneus]